MRRTRIQISEDAARAASRTARVATIPVDLDRVCEAHNLQCLERSLDDELSGMSFIRGGVGYVVINSKHHENRRRFTLAHEIGHHILHADYLASNVHVDTGILRRDELSSEGAYSKEIEANNFAAELLMPRSEMQKLTSLDLSDDEKVAEVAKMFGVSVTAFVYRLSNLANRRE